MQAPKVSICIPAYRQQKLLLRALGSVLEQDYTDFEVIVTDDSPDGAVEDALRGVVDGRLTYIRNRQRKGSPANWNEAVAHATGEYVKILHHDDWFPSRECLGKFVGALEVDGRCDFAFSATEVHDVAARAVRIHTPSAEELHALTAGARALFGGNFVGAPSATIFRRSSFIPFDERLKWVVDVEFYMQMLFKNPCYRFVAEPLVCTTAGAPHQVTAECSGVKQVELFEWLYLYCKIEQQYGAAVAMSEAIRGLIEQYDVKSATDFSFDAAPYPIPLWVRIMLVRRRVMKPWVWLRCFVNYEIQKYRGRLT